MEDCEQLLAARSDRRPNVHRRLDAHVQSLETKAVADLRRRLKYYFMNPCEKYQARRRKPWKLMLQILKIALITAQVGCGPKTAGPNGRQLLPLFLFLLFQLVSFGLSNEMMVTFKDDNLMTFRHLFLRGYKDHHSGSYALYTKSDVYDHIFFIIDKVGGQLTAQNDLGRECKLK